MKNKKYAILTLALTSVITLNGVSAYANTTINENNKSVSSRSYSQSASVPKTVNGVTFSGYTMTQTGNVLGIVSALTVVNTSSKVPGGYIGAHTALYKEGSGTAVSSSSWAYNGSSTNYFQRTAQTKSAKKGTNYRTHGTMKCYNKSTGSYVGVTLNKSPYVTYSLDEENIDDEYLSYKTMNLTISEDEKEERVEMYEEKGMIAAEGLNGKEGYISLEDMGVYENPETPEEALKLQEENLNKYGDYKDIPVYDEDGVSVIDTFRVWFK